MSNAATLSAYVQANYDAEELIHFTNWRTPGNTTLDTSVLELACLNALSELVPMVIGSYDPTNYPWHAMAASLHVMWKLALKAGQWTRAKMYREALDPYWKQPVVSASITPRTNSPYNPTKPKQGTRPATDDSNLTDYLALP